MSDPKYARFGTPFIKLAEECSEVIQSCMKIERFGLDNYHPVTKEINRAALLREIDDLQERISEARAVLAQGGNDDY